MSPFQRLILNMNKIVYEWGDKMNKKLWILVGILILISTSMSLCFENGDKEKNESPVPFIIVAGCCTEQEAKLSGIQARPSKSRRAGLPIPH